MKKTIILICVIITGFYTYGQNNVVGKKITALDSLVADTIRARTQGSPYIVGLVGGSNTQIQFNNSGVFGGSANLTWDGDTLEVDNLKIDGGKIYQSTNLDNYIEVGSNIFMINSGNDIIQLGSTTTDGTSRTINVNGSEANIDLVFASKGTGNIDFSSDNLTDIGSLTATTITGSTSVTTPTLTSSGILTISSGSGNVQIQPNNAFTVSAGGTAQYQAGASGVPIIQSSGDITLTPNAANHVNISAGGLEIAGTEVISSARGISATTGGYSGNVTITSTEPKFITVESDASNKSYSLRGAGGSLFIRDESALSNRLQLETDGTVTIVNNLLLSSTLGETGTRVSNIYTTNQTTTNAETVDSDSTLKANITTLEGVDISELRPVTYTWKNDSLNKLHYGVIAQEVQHVYPELVVRHGETLGVAYTEMIPILLAKIKELEARIEALEQ